MKFQVLPNIEFGRSYRFFLEGCQHLGFKVFENIGFQFLKQKLTAEYVLFQDVVLYARNGVLAIQFRVAFRVALGERWRFGVGKSKFFWDKIVLIFLIVSILLLLAGMAVVGSNAAGRQVRTQKFLDFMLLFRKLHNYYIAPYQKLAL